MLATTDTWKTALANITADLAPSSARKYTQRLEVVREFMAGRTISKATLGEFKRMLADQGKAPSTINGHLAAVRKLIDELVGAGYIPASEGYYISSIKGAKQLGQPAGNWLSVQQANKLLAEPNTETLKGKRDLAILATLIMCGLRRSELVSLTVGHMQQREGHWVFLDLRGKHGRIRTVKIPVPVKRTIGQWLGAKGDIDGLTPDTPLFVGMQKGDRLNGGSAMSPQAIYDLVRKYGEAIGVSIAAHDTRRTFAKLAHKGGAPLEVISYDLGHASLETTQKYLGLELDLDKTSSDFIHLKL